jgi:hypothetical protein
MRKTSSIGAAAVGIHAVMPKAATAPRRSRVQRADERDDNPPDESEQAPPPPGMGKLVDRTA